MPDNSASPTAGLDKTEKPKSDKDLVEEIIEQRKASLRYYNSNYYQEFSEIYRNLHARTKAFKVANRDGDMVEDTSGRTNVCVPDHFIMQQRATARLTRNPPNLRVRGGPDTDEAQFNRDKVSAKLMYNWDRAESQRSFKKVVASANAFGIGVGKVYYDEVPIVRVLRKLTKTLQPQDFQNLANAKNPRIAAAVQQFGPRLRDSTPLGPDDYSQMIAAFGNDVALKQSAIKYKGPVLDHVFFGDFFPEPGFKSLASSGFCIENSNRDAEWLEYWHAQTTIDPETGEESPVFPDIEAMQKVLDSSETRTYLDEEENSLRRNMREEIELADPITAGKPIKAPKKRFMVDERHAIVNGHLCVDFVGQESTYLGRLWYPWDTYGKYTFCEMILIPDLLEGIGMSTLRVTRWLMQLRNARQNQTTDFINNKLLPVVLQRRGTDETAYDLVRTNWMRVCQVDNPSDFVPFQDPQFPQEAWNDQAQYQQEMQQVDPTTTSYAPGTDDVALAGKFATTAKLQDKAADSVTADKLDNIGMFIRDVVELQLTMDQQAMDEAQSVPKSYFERIDAVSIRENGNAKEIKVDPMDMQEAYEVLPEQGSTLAADDEFKVAALQQTLVLAERHPDIVNLRYICTKLIQATPGVNAEEAILPPPPPQPPVPPVKMNISVQIKWEDLAPDVQAALLQHEGLPTDVTHVLGAAKMIGKASEAADSAANLESPVDYGLPNGQNGAAPKGPTRGKSKLPSKQ